jgi:hypothetical protein
MNKLMMMIVKMIMMMIIKIILNPKMTTSKFVFGYTREIANEGKN